MAKSVEDVHEREGKNGAEEILRLRKSLEMGGEERREGRERKRVEARFSPPPHARPHVRGRGRRGRGMRDGYCFRCTRKRKREGRNERETGERKR